MHTFSTRVVLLAALLATSQFGFGQTSPPRALYPTTARSDAWMDSVSRLPLPQQLAAIRTRVLADTILRHPQQYVCLMPLSATQREAYSLAQQPRVRAEQARPAGPLLLYTGNSCGLATNEQAQTTAFVQKLNTQAVRHIEFIKSTAAATVLYGTRGANGVVRLTTRLP